MYIYIIYQGWYKRSNVRVLIKLKICLLYFDKMSRCHLEKVFVNFF